MRHIAILLLILATVLTGCQPKVVPMGPWVKKIDSEELSRLVLNFSQDMKRERHLFLEDSWAAYDDNIKKICLRYSSQRLLAIKEARLLIVELVEEFLKRLNNHQILGFELETYPFTAANIDVRINFESYMGLYVDPLYVGLIWLQAGCVHFYAFDRKVDNIDWNHDRFEPYFKSRELALIQKEADIPFVEVARTPKKASSYVYDRYEPYRAQQPYSSNVIYPPRIAYTPGQTVGAVDTVGKVSTGTSVIIPTPGSTNVIIPPADNQGPVMVPRIPRPAIQPVSNARAITNSYAPRNVPGYYPVVPGQSNAFYSPGSTTDLPPYNPNIPAGANPMVNTNFYQSLPPYNPSAPASY